jgi:serine/threonine protein kinase
MNQLIDRSSIPCDSATKELWFNDLPDDVRAFLDANPQVRRNKSMVIDLAYEEFCREIEAGNTPDIDAFCDRFPTFRTTLRDALEAHCLAEEFPSLLTGGDSTVWPIAGETFLGFHLLGEMGRGAFARVFLATEIAIANRLVVVKVSPQGTREAMILGQVKHPHVVPIYGAPTDPVSKLTAVCMPYLGTATLATALDRAFAEGKPRSAHVFLECVPGNSAPAPLDARPLAPDPILTSGTYAEGVCLIGAQLADALASVHERGILHRDLKPSNVFLGPDGRPMLIDFNLSADGAPGDDRPGGTFPYMAPEALQAFRDTTHPAPGPAADVFSLGVILFELLAGKRPFGQVDPLMPSDEICARLLAAQQAGPPALRKLCPQPSPALAKIVTQCLAFDPAQRPTAAQLTSALRRDLSWWRRLPRELLRHPRKLAASAAAVGLLIAASFAVAAVRPPEQERLQFEAKRAYTEHRYDDSLRTLDRLLAKHPEIAEYHYLEGRVYLARENPALAEVSFAHKSLENDGRAAACRAYALALKKEQVAGTTAGVRALELNYETAEVHNNLAYSYLQSWKLKNAEKSLNRALELDERLPAVHLNRLFLALAWMQSSSAKRRLPEVQRILEQAMECCPPSAELHEVAARLCAAAGEHNSDWDVNVLPYLVQAHVEGRDFSTLDEDILFKRFQTNTLFAGLLHPPPQTAPIGTSRLIDPAKD